MPLIKLPNRIDILYNVEIQQFIKLRKGHNLDMPNLRMAKVSKWGE